MSKKYDVFVDEIISRLRHYGVLGKEDTLYLKNDFSREKFYEFVGDVCEKVREEGRRDSTKNFKEDLQSIIDFIDGTDSEISDFVKEIKRGQ